MKKLSLALLSGLVILALLPMVASAATLEWTQVQIDTAGFSTAIDAASENHLVGAYLGTTGLRFATSTNGGTSWITSSVDPISIDGIDIEAISETTYLIVYRDNLAEIKFAKSVNSGTSWTTTTVTTCGVNSCGSPTIVATATDVYHVTYFDSTAFDLVYTTSTDGGATWSAAILDAGDICDVGQIGAFDSSHLFISFSDGVTGGTTCTHASTWVYSTSDGGTTWAETQIDIDPGSGTALSIQGGSATVSTTRGGFAYYRPTAPGAGGYKFVTSFDAGVTWAGGTMSTNNIPGPSSNIGPAEISLAPIDAQTIAFVGYFCVPTCGANDPYYIELNNFAPGFSDGDFTTPQEVFTGACDVGARTGEGSGIAILELNRYAFSTSGCAGGNGDYYVYLSTLAPAGPGGSGDIIGTLLTLLEDAWGFSWKYIVGLILIGGLVWKVRDSQPLVVGLIAFIGVIIAIFMLDWETWILFVLIFLIIAVAGHRLFGGKESEDE